MAVLDSSIVNVALPRMSGTLGATIEQITWVVTGYILANVIIMPLVALLSQRFGRKNFYMTSVMLFTVASMACGLARSLPMMVFFRAVQGIGGGVLLTVSQAILRETFPAGRAGNRDGNLRARRRARAGIRPDARRLAHRPVLMAVDLLHQRADRNHQPDARQPVRRRSVVSRRRKGEIDWLGLALMIIGLGSLQLMLESGERNDWFESASSCGWQLSRLSDWLSFVWRELTS